MQQIRLLSSTAILSIMIWLVADYSLTETATIRVRIHPQAADESAMRVALAEDEPSVVEVKIAGKRTQVEELRSRAPLGIPLSISTRAAKTYRIRLDEEFRKAAILREVDVQQVMPETIDVEVDRDTTVTMPISVKTTGGLVYEIEPEAEPTEVAVTISERALSQIPKDDRKVIIEPDNYLTGAAHGVLGTEVVPLTPVVASISVLLNPDFVKLRFKIKDLAEEAVISAVPIKIEASPDIFNGYKIEFKDAGPVLTQPLTIKGPPDMIERVRRGELRIFGVVSLTAANKAAVGSLQYLTPEFKLPKGLVRVGDVESLEFKLVPIKSPALGNE